MAQVGASFQILVTASERDTTVFPNAGECTVRMTHPIRMDNIRDGSVWESCLTTARVSFSQKNITTANGTGTLSVSVDSGSNYVDITFPDALLTIDEWNAYVDAEVITAGGTTGDIVISPDYTTGKIALTLSAAARADLTPASSGRWWYLMGFTEATGIVATTTTAPNKARWMDGMSILTVSCPQLSAGRRSATSNNLTAVSLVFDGVYRHSLKSHVEQRPLWGRCPTQQSALDAIELIVHDELGRVVNLGSEATVTLEFSIRERYF